MRLSLRNAALSSSGWGSIYLELHQQPKFDTIVYQHTMHVIAYGLSGSSLRERWLDGKLRTETRSKGDIAIIPVGISHRCNWNTSVEFMLLAIESVLLSFFKKFLESTVILGILPN
ncbi:MAG: hypothetical protein PUP91_31705 [Rhizonema sp. PD37]|nr:hypothetical protein [Rhizonema sp. PD37]